MMVNRICENYLTLKCDFFNKYSSLNGVQTCVSVFITVFFFYKSHSHYLLNNNYDIEVLNWLVHLNPNSFLIFIPA